MLALQPEMPSSQGIDCGRQQPRARKGRDKVGAPQVLQLRELGRRTITVALDRIHCRRTEAFLRNYPEGQWTGRERERLTNAIDRVAGNQP